MDIYEVLEHFKGVINSGENSYRALCPAHYDKKPSLSISQGSDGKILLYCHAGCATTDILEAAGLKTEDLFNEPLQKTRPKGFAAIYDYTDEDGNYLFSKFRTHDKKFFCAIIKGQRYETKGVPKDKPLYNLRRVVTSLKSNALKPIYIVEGEKDVETLKRLGMVATTSPTVNAWKPEYTKYFKDAWVVILYDNDEAGEKYKDAILRDLTGTAYALKAVKTSTKEKGDVTDYIEEGHSREELLKLIEAKSWATRGNAIKELSRPTMESYTAESLIDTEFPELFFIVDDFLPAGSAILAAPAKAGKSWMMMQLAITAAEGGYFLNHKTNKCQVVYFALEDSPRRLKDRLRKMLSGKKPPEGVEFITQAPRVEDGLLDEIERRLSENANIKLVIIDTLQKVKPPSSKTETAYEQDYKLLGKITELARKNDCCILLIHHLRKGTGFNADPFEKILGSTALQGATDTMAVIEREKRTENGAVLHITGRDISPQDLALTFNNYQWESLGDVGSIELMRMELAYRNNPAVMTLKKRLEEIENDENEPIKEYVVRARDFRDDVMKETGEVVGTSERNFMTEMKNFDIFLLKDGIEHIEPTNTTTHKGKGGRFHRYRYKKGDIP